MCHGVGGAHTAPVTGLPSLPTQGGTNGTGTMVGGVSGVFTPSSPTTVPQSGPVNGTGSQVSQVPTGAPETGGGSTALAGDATNGGMEGALLAGGLLIGAAAAAEVLRRRTRRA